MALARFFRVELGLRIMVSLLLIRFLADLDHNYLLKPSLFPMAFIGNFILLQSKRELSYFNVKFGK